MANQRGNVSVFVSILTYVLIALGVLIILGGITFGVLTLLSPPPPPTAATGFAALTAVAAFLWIFAGGMLGLLCFSIAAVLSLLAAQARQSQLQQTALEQLRTGMQSLDVALRIPSGTSTPARAPVIAKQTAALEEGTQPLLLDLLEQVRDSALMSDSQRQQLAAIHWSKRKSTLTESIERHMLSGSWAAARAQLEELLALMPQDAEVTTLADRVSGEYSARLSEDLHAAQSQLRHLLSIAAWQEANELVAGLENKYPQATDIEQMRAQINRERDTFERENKERILGELADATDRKQWRRAVLAVEEFIQRYPVDKLTERLRVDLVTLQENSLTHERKEQELLFKDLLKRQRYEEALTVAKGVIALHPNSPAAAELTKLLPKVEDLIRQHHQAAPTA
jgi:hypothetical protein